MFDTLFSGATKEQVESIKKTQNAETMYMDWIYNLGYTPTIEACERKYKELKNN